ncbi:hypothetical protein D3C79_890270 [compost metagenome]
MQQVEQLALVLVNAFDLYVEQRFGVDRDAYAVLDDAGQGPLAVQALGGELLAETGLVGERYQIGQAPLGVVLELRP